METNTTLVVYSITERGPDIVHVKSILPHEKIQEMALYHLLLVAQGTWHHTGVFVLPIPVDKIKETHKAIFYGFRIHDPEQQDPRTNKTRYSCVIVFCANDQLNNLNLIDLQKEFDKFLAKYTTYKEIKTSAFFTQLSKFIGREIYLKKKIYANNVNPPIAKPNVLNSL